MSDVASRFQTSPLAWRSKCRGLLIRYEKQAENDLGLLKLACGLICPR